MTITRSSRHFRTVLSLATAVLLAACTQAPTQPDSTPPPGEPNTLGGAAQTDAGGPSQGPAPFRGPRGPKAAPAPAPEGPVALRPDHPQSYTVAPGDTLWSIAKRFLQNPWQWRQVWRQNPQVGNPHRIYPGDVLRFSYDASGNPQLEAARGEVPLIKLSPEVRVESLTQPIPPVPRDAIQAFLIRGEILSDAEWRAQPYIVADDDDQTVYADRDRVYVRGGDLDQQHYSVFRPGEELREPGSNRSLGIPGIYVGQAILERDEQPATFLLANTVAPVRAGDRLLPVLSEPELYNFDPHPAPDVEGMIVGRLDADVTQITQDSSVIINLGADEGMQPGHVLAVFGQDRRVEDKVSGGTVRIPGERAGLLMVYKVHERVSYGLVMQAERSIRLRDRVTSP
ncbi:MAG: LysM peptidoglycan-binding domain-containing protein [Candidatus Competibacter sp.]|nr:LysM peptidoglycan-binding domain-containing protein [Candidatus Competibacter sp.]